MRVQPVTYTPPLMEQIRWKATHSDIRSAWSGRIITVRVRGTYVYRVDAKTQTSTDEPQQFELADDGVTLTIIPKYGWVTNPEIIDVDRWSV